MVEDLTKKLEQLPAPLQQEVADFIDFLAQKHRSGRQPKGFDFAWEGGLSNLKEQYTSVELQHKASE